MGTHEYHPITSLLKHIPLLNWIIVNTTHQHVNDGILQAIYCYACHVVVLLYLHKNKEPHETGQRAVGWPPLLYGLLH